MNDRRRAVTLAGHTGDEPTARDGLLDVDPVVRGSALGALVRMGAATVDDVRRALDDDDVGVRRRAVEEAGRAGLDVADALVDRLGDVDATVVEAAAFALGELGSPSGPGVVNALAAAAGHADVLVREAAVAALGAVGDPSGLATVLQAADDVATVRRRAVLALAAFEGPEVEAALGRLASDRDRQVRQAAEDLLHGWGASGP